MPEIITIELDKEVLSRLHEQGAISTEEFKVKREVVKDDLFVEDETHKQLVRNLVKAKNALEEYEFKKRHHIL